MTFEDYWENYGELHASMCGGDLKQFAKEFWLSGAGNSEKMLERLKDEIVKEDIVDIILKYEMELKNEK